MKKALLILLSVLSLAAASQGQDFKWGAQNNLLPFNSMVEKDGFIYGTSYSSMLAKADASGKILWSRPDQKYMNGMFIRPDHKGNLYVAGGFNGTPTIDTKAGQVKLSTFVGDIFLAKMDTAGNVLWIKQSTSTDAAYLSAMEIDNNDNVYLGGTFNKKVTLGTANFDCRGAIDVFVAKYGSDGSFAWAKQIGGTNTDGITGILVSPIGAVYVSGSYEGNATFDTKPAPATPAATGYLVNFDATTGQVASVATSTTMIYNHIAYNPQKSAIYANVLFIGDITAGGHTVSSPSGVASAILTMYPDFKPLDVYQIYVAPAVMVCGNDGSVTMAGSFEGSITMKPGLNYSSYGESDIYMLCYDNKGHFEWSLHSGGPNIDNITSMVYSQDQLSLFVGGTVQSGPAKFGKVTIPGDFSGDGFILKMGAPMSGIAPSQFEYENQSLILYPNPVKTQGTLNLELGHGPTCWTIEIYDMQGRVVLSQNLNDGNSRLNTTTLKKGMYMLKASSAIEVRTGKFLVE